MATVFMCWQLSSGAGAGTKMDKNGVENVYFTAPNNRINSRENAPKKKTEHEKIKRKANERHKKRQRNSLQCHHHLAQFYYLMHIKETLSDCEHTIFLLPT